MPADRVSAAHFHDAVRRSSAPAVHPKRSFVFDKSSAKCIRRTLRCVSSFTQVGVHLVEGETLRLTKPLTRHGRPPALIWHALCINV
jgi:hypothetical protein